MWDFTGTFPASLSVGEEECGEGGGEEADYEEEATFRSCAELSLLLPRSCSKPSAAAQQALAEANCFPPPPSLTNCCLQTQAGVVVPASHAPFRRTALQTRGLETGVELCVDLEVQSVGAWVPSQSPESR